MDKQKKEKDEAEDIESTLKKLLQKIFTLNDLLSREVLEIKKYKENLNSALGEPNVTAEE